LIPLFTLTLFVASMTCHGELARMRPAPRHLTAFFLMVSVGGAAGGAFVGLAAPRIFSSYLELRLGLVFWLVIMATVAYRHGPAWRGRDALTAAVVAIAVGVAALLWHQSAAVAQDSKLIARNFYGTLRVVESGQGEDAYRAMLHGTISHGKQFLAPDRRDWATTYYAPESGVGRALHGLRNGAPQRVGMVGLGTGTLLSYARPGDVYRVYEINPLVVEVAHEYFGYLADAKGTVEIALGDARLTMEREVGQGYDLLVVDAFSSDSIPVHLLTREAFATYFRHVRPGGVVAVHISNRYLDLAPVVKQAAAHFGKRVVRVRNEDDYVRGVYSSTWLLLADSAEALARLRLDDAAESLDDVATVPLWTDQFSNVYELARWRRPD
jgi:spermidine synthase